MTDAMLTMFALGVVAGGGQRSGLRGWWLARHSALLNQAVRDGSVRRYGRELLHTGRRDRVAPDRYKQGG